MYFLNILLLFIYVYYVCIINTTIVYGCCMQIPLHEIIQCSYTSWRILEFDHQNAIAGHRIYWNFISSRSWKILPIFGAYHRSTNVKDEGLASFAKEIAKLCEDLHRE